jgi:hypothetical protein
MIFRAQRKDFWAAVIARIESHEVVRQTTRRRRQNRELELIRIDLRVEKFLQSSDEGRLVDVIAAPAANLEAIERLDDRIPALHL